MLPFAIIPREFFPDLSIYIVGNRGFYENYRSSREFTDRFFTCL